MPQGLQIYNDNGKIQFDSLSSAFGLLDSGTIVTQDYFVDPNNGDPLYYKNTSNEGTGLPTLPLGTDIVAYYSPQAFAYISVFQGTLFAQSQPCEYIIPGGRVPRTGDNEHIIYWYAFKSMKTLIPPLNGVGLTIWKDNGELAWDSNLKPIMITGVATYNTSDFPSQKIVPNNPSAVILSNTYTTIRNGVQYVLGTKGHLVSEFAYNDLGTTISSIGDPIYTYDALGISELSLL